MFGIRRSKTSFPSELDASLLAVLDRQIDIPALASLVQAVRDDWTEIEIAHCAIVFDSSVFLRMSDEGIGADIVDYVNLRHDGPIILPGQSIQEFWNNQLNVVDTVAEKLKKRFEEFRKEAERVDKNFGDYADRFSKVISDFGDEHGHVYEEGVVQKTVKFLEVLEKRAIVPFVSRDLYNSRAMQRKRTKTPPGFRDPGDGDFYIWVDMLRGLQRARADGVAFKRVVLVTQDKKDDWSRGGVAHPVLAAEVRGLFNVEFRICDMKFLAGLIATSS